MSIESGARRIYFNLSDFNTAPVDHVNRFNGAISCKKETNMNFPLLENLQTGEYDVALARMRIPIDGIPDGTIGTPNHLASLQSFVVKTNKIPVNGEWDNQGNYPFLNDIMVDNGTLVLGQPFLYEPFFYRRSSMKAQGSLHLIDIEVFYRLENGELYPLPINAQQGWTVKIAILHQSISTT